MLIVLVLCAFALPSLNGGPHQVPLGLTGPQPAVEAVEGSLDGQEWDVQRYEDPHALQSAIEEREAVGGLALTDEGTTVYTAGAASQQASAAISALGTGLAEQQGGEATVEDVVPFPEQDPQGAGFTASSLPLVFSGIVPALVLLRLLPGQANLWPRLAGAALFCLVAGPVVAAVLQYGFGSLDGDYWTTGFGLSLGMAALVVPFLALERLFGFAALVAGAAVMMLLGNPLSGMAGPYWLPAGWAALGQVLPPAPRAAWCGPSASSVAPAPEPPR